MKKFIKILVCLCLCVISISLTACGKSDKIDAPASDALIFSNGGIVVQKGDYLYYTNGYQSVDDIKKSNLNDKFTVGGLYVTKMNSNGGIVRNENDNIVKNDRLSSRLNGFEATDLHIFGNYMYFTTFNNEETKNGGLQTKHLEIYRVKLNGTGRERVYRSGIDFETDDKRVVTFNYYAKGNNVYILVKESDTLKRIQCTNKSVGYADVISKDVLSCIPSSDMFNGFNDVFFTTKDEDQHYVINRYNIESNQVTKKSTCDAGDSISSLLEAKNGYLYFYATFDNGSGSEFLYRISFEDLQNNSITTSSVKLTTISYTKVYVLEDDKILAIGSSKTFLINATNPMNLISEQTLPVSATIMQIKDGYIYYYTDKTISRFNWTNNTIAKIYDETNTICNYQFDILGSNLYYYATVGGNDYLFRVAIGMPAENNEPEIVGNYESADAPQKD